MPKNLLRSNWAELDSAELRLLLAKRIGGLGQYRDRSENPNKLYLPLADSTCRIVLIFRGNEISTIERGPAFDASEWDRIGKEIENSILAGPMKVGRNYSFSSFRVSGSWRGERSGVQILPPPDDAPRAPIEMAEHPFILEFPIRVSDFSPITNHRWMREHRRLTLLLNVLLAGRTSLQSQRSQNFWAWVSRDHDRQASKWIQKATKWIQKVRKFLYRWSRRPGSASKTEDEIKWVQPFFFAKLGDSVTEELSSPAGEQLEEVESEEYYTQVGHDGQGLRVPSDLDDSICLYHQLSPTDRAKFDRATFWMDAASRQWTFSVSSSFASLVSAIESFTDQGPGATERFQTFFESYAPDGATRSRRSKMYNLRSDILHGSELMQLDQDLAFGWDPAYLNQRELHNDLWSLTRIALRNWLKDKAVTRC